MNFNLGDVVVSIEVCYAKGLKSLADALIEKLKVCWKSPFESPVIVFPDAKLEQWFKQYYLTKEKAVANLNSRRIDRLIMDYLRACYLKIPGNENKIVEELTPEIFAHAMIAFLKKNDCENLKRDEFKAIKKYVAKNKVLENNVETSSFNARLCETENTLDVDEGKLYDFAVRLATLFLEYERSRPPKGYLYGTSEKEGFLEAWNRETFSEKSLFFGGASKETELWEHQLYAEILQKKSSEEPSFLDVAYAEYQKAQNSHVEKGEKISYLTLPYLYNEVKRHDAFLNGDFAKLSRDIFVFGLSGMGQYYYIVLKQLAELHNVYAFVPNPCMEFWEDMDSLRNWIREHSVLASSTEAETEDLEYLKDFNGKEKKETDEKYIYENALLQKWGFYGRDTVRLWNLLVDGDVNFVDVSFEDSAESNEKKELLQAVQYLITKRQNRLSENDGNWAAFNRDFKEDKSLVLRSAPSKIREIEDLHTRVCELVKEGVRLRDILVVSPRIEEYVTSIHQIFNMKDCSSDINVRIPYCIVDPDAENSFVTKVFESLFNIAKKQDFTRNDFFELINNPVVQNIRHIVSADVQAFETWITKMGVYRNGTGNSVVRKDWEKVLKRLLLARVSDEIQIDKTLKASNAFGENQAFEIIPYEDMDSVNANRLFKFVSIVDDLKAWMNFSKKPYQKSLDEEEYFDAVKEQLKKWAFMTEPSEDLLGEKLVYSSAISSLNALKFEFFAGLENVSFEMIGRTIMSNAKKTVYSKGEIFVNGLTFMKFKPNRILPAKYIFFIGAGAKVFPGKNRGDSLDLRQKQYWLGDATPVSKNKYGFLSLLMNAENGFYVSYVNKDLQKDEEFYVSSVVEDLKAFVQGAINSEKSSENQELTEYKLEERKTPLDEIRPWGELYTSRALRNKKFYEKLTEKENESEVSEGKFESEPPKRVKFSQLRKFLEDPCKFQIERRLCDEEENEQRETLEPIDVNRLENAIALKDVFKKVDCSSENAIQKVYEHLSKEKSLPDGIFGKKVAERISEKVKDLQNLVQEIKISEQEKVKFSDIEFDKKCRIDFGNWILEDSCAWHTKAGSVFIDVTSSITKAKFLSIYVSALAYLAEQQNENEKMIRLIVFGTKENKCEELSLTMNSKKATEILVEIYLQAFESCYKLAIPINLWFDSKLKNLDWSTYKNKMIGYKSEWQYFKKNKLFKFEDICGFRKENFEFEWQKAVENMKTMIQFNELK